MATYAQRAQYLGDALVPNAPATFKKSGQACSNGSQSMTGYLDEIRVTVGTAGGGAARYTSAYTPATAAFPNS